MKKFFSLFATLLLSACASKKAVVVQAPPPVPGTIISAEGMESIRYSENLKAYPMGRYIDPNNGLVMHEAHTLYRVETTAKWNLHPNAPIHAPAGPVTRIIDPAHTQVSPPPEVVAEIAQQKAATQTFIDQGQRINQTLSQFSQAASSLKESNLRLLQESSTNRQRLEALEEQFRKQQQFTTSSSLPAPTPKGTNDW